MNKDTNISFKTLRYQRLLLFGWCALIAVTIFFLLFPVNNGRIRLYFLIAIPLIFSGATFIIWEQRKIRWIPIVFLLILSLLFILPGRKINRQNLRERYIFNARKYEGVRYIWGGENPFGIDCSGLIRKGIINANLQEGLATANSACMRKAFELWWYDCSARALKDHYRNWTKSLFQADSINKIDHRSLKPGDFAVTMDGVHTLLYLGKNEWIEADPGIGKVILVTVPVKNNVWFDTPVQILRWKELEAQCDN